MKKCLLFLLGALLLTTRCFAAQSDIIGPPGSGAFGTNVTVLPNGNFVVTDPLFDLVSPAVANVGAVFLYSPEGALISTLTGSTANNLVGNEGVTVLASGNFVVISQGWDNGAATNAGAVTWGSATTGFIGGAAVVVSPANSLVGSILNDGVGDVFTLPNGNYVVRSTLWNIPAGNADVGAVTWCDGSSGTVGTVSAANSLVGSTVNDQVGSSGVTALTNGNYVVVSSNWDNPSPATANVGAVTWGNGNTGISGAVSAANSLVGSTLEDKVGNNGVVALTNGNYVVGSRFWNLPVGGTADVGAATWGNGSTGISGPVTTANSLIGASLNDNVGSGGLRALTNGNYVVSSPKWNNPSPAAAAAGAVTWGDGSTGTVGTVSVANSLVGSTLNDSVGFPDIIVLANGNYVVGSPLWDNPAPSAIDAGAVTWGNGSIGVKGIVAVTNSLVGISLNDKVGSGGMIALANGNYVVKSVDWNRPAPTSAARAGAATWGNGSTGIKGTVSASNSLVGSTFDDKVGEEVVALPNGNYVVVSSFWNNTVPSTVDAGAATWGNGSTGIVGSVSSANSLIGSTAGDNVGFSGVTALTNGNYVVCSPFWDSTAPATVDVGAATWGNGSTGIKGTVSTANSLVGTVFSDGVGIGGSTALTNGNYLVESPSWINKTPAASRSGAVTWGNGSTGIVGGVSAANSLVGSTVNDRVGEGGLKVFSDGSYIIHSNVWDNTAPVAVDAGAVSLGNGATGTVGLVGAANSVLGTVASSGANLTFGYDPARHQMIVGRRDSNIVTRFINGQIHSLAKTNLDAPGAFDIAFSTAGTAAVNASGAVLADFTLTGAGSVGGKNRAIFFAPSTRGPLDLVLQTGDLLSTLSGGLPANAKATALTVQISQQARRGVFQTTISGTGITTSNNLLLMMDNGVGVSLLHRTGQAINGLSNATAAKFVEVLQSHDRDLITVSYQLKTSTTPVVTTSNDTGLLLLDHAGAIGANLAAREGASATAFAGSGTFGQFTGRAAAGQGSTIHFGALFTPTIGPSVTGIFRMTTDGVTKATTAAVGSPAPGAGANFASFPSLSSIGSDALFKATLTGAAAINEGLWRGPATLLLRKGDAVDAVNLPGVKFGSTLRFWPAGSTQVIVQVTLTGTGVSATSNQALVLRQANGAYLVLLRTGNAAPGCGPAKVLAISAVDVNPVTGRYVVLGTLSGALATANQALWSGNPALGDDTTSQILRQPVLRLRKGQNYTTENTPQSLVRSITLTPAIDTTGAGGRGLAQCIGSGGDIAVYILGDRSLTELVMLPP